MSIAGESTHLKVVTVGDFDPQSDDAIEYDFIGRVIAGRYTIREMIGGGGMADVFRATDEELGVDVAIKLLKPRMASDELRARMVQEARAAAQVRHDNLVRVFGTGKLDSTAYIVMEMLDGPNLEQYLREYRDQRIPGARRWTCCCPRSGPARCPRSGLCAPRYQDGQHPDHPQIGPATDRRRDRHGPREARSRAT
ncbi:protein kinase [Nannocystis sp.]|uniref:protein kinase domain-containing protein n=1 Tax=Nannocystis sp. TaxID=1962667 RepID=UPI0025DF01D1|nr:protein kinase [Nannocystis sp.]MBK7825025.1 protein kinase [Nannocystis sp.]